MHWIGGVFFQLLPQFQDVIVHGTGGRIVVISPNFVQQFVASDDALWILHHELQRFEFLSGKRCDFALDHDFHLGEVDLDVFERELVCHNGAGGAAKCGTNTRQ